MRGRRVVVTGLGIVSPVGSTVSEVWERIGKGDSGIGQISYFDAEKFACRIAGEVSPFEYAPEFGSKQQKQTDKFIHYGVAASHQAITDADIVGNIDPRRFGVSVGSGIGGIHTISQQQIVLSTKGVRRVSPFFVPSSIVNMLSGWIAILYGAQGSNIAIATACATGTHSIGEAARKIAYGEADAIVAGGSEACVSELAVAGFASARALSFRNDEPQLASRPFDADRDGFVIGEGAGVLVIEEYEHAKARGTNIYCELIGYGASCDASHITAPLEDGKGAQNSMKAAIADAEIQTTDVDHINAHGTSTPLGDLAETKAIRNLFGFHADNILVSATKSMTGHLLGAAGGIEAVFSVLAIKHQQAPPTINLDNPSEGCDLNYVAGKQAVQAKIDTVLSNSFGFGGTNGSLLFIRI